MNKSDPAWSPDGRSIAYTASTPAITLRGFDLESADTREIYRVKVGAMLSKASYDLKRIAYVNSEDGRLWVSDVEGQTNELLVNQTGILEIEWSRDSRWIAYVRNGKIWYVPSGGGVPTRLAGSPVQDSEPDWSPDNLQIAFISNAGVSGSLWLGDLTANSSRVLIGDTVSVANPAWSPDGLSIAFEITRSDTTSIWKLELATETRTQLSDSTRNARQPLWSPDGQKVAYFGDDNTVWVVSNTGDIIAHATFNHDHSNAFWHPDSQTICFSEPGIVSHIETFSLETRQVTEITSIADSRNDAWPAWYPDASRLVFSRDDTASGLSRFYVASLADGSIAPMHSDDVYLAGPEYESNAAISPDGNWLIGDGLASPFLYRLDGSPAISLGGYIPSSILEPQWGPDSQSAVFTTPIGLSIIAVDSSLDISRIDIRPPGNERYRDPAWSPEYDGSDSYIAASGLRGIYVMKPDGSRQVLVVEGGESPTWSPSERRLAFIMNGYLYAVSVIHDVPQ